MTVKTGPKIVTDGLILLLDAGNKESYPGTGNTWYDISGQGAHAVSNITMPVFNNYNRQSYFNFSQGTNNQMESVNILQNYKDFFTVARVNTNGLNTIFSRYDNVDNGFRFGGSVAFRPEAGSDNNDWYNNAEADLFVDGIFDYVNNGGNAILNDKLHFIRGYRATNVWGATWRYEVSSGYYSPRSFSGDIAMLFCYDRKLTNEEVLQNYNALKPRFNL